MSGIAQQLGLDQTFYVQLVFFAVLFVVLSQVYFKPFLKLIEARHKRVIEDREAANQLVIQADAKFEEYKRRMAEERANARKEYEAILSEVKKEEAALLGNARAEAKKITQEAADSVNQQRQNLKTQLEADVEGLARQISETLLVRRDK